MARTARARARGPGHRRPSYSNAAVIGRSRARGAACDARAPPAPGSTRCSFFLDLLRRAQTSCSRRSTPGRGQGLARASSSTRATTRPTAASASARADPPPARRRRTRHAYRRAYERSDTARATTGRCWALTALFVGRGPLPSPRRPSTGSPRACATPGQQVVTWRRSPTRRRRRLGGGDGRSATRAAAELGGSDSGGSDGDRAARAAAASCGSSCGAQRSKPAARRRLLNARAHRPLDAGRPHAAQPAGAGAAGRHRQLVRAPAGASATAPGSWCPRWSRASASSTATSAPCASSCASTPTSTRSRCSSSATTPT